MIGVLVFFAVMEAGELRRRHRQWPYLAAGVLLTLLMLARLYLGLEWLSGALMGVLSGLAWAAAVGFAYRQRARRHFSGAAASMIFYGALALLFAWQVGEHTDEDLAALQSTTVTRSIDEEAWWAGAWRSLPVERAKLSTIGARTFDAQFAATPERLAELLRADGWAPVPESDWRWFLQALNPEPTERSLPLIGRAYEGRPETLLLEKNIAPEGRLLTIRLWDSGVRLAPGGQEVYLGQVTEEILIQRLGLFSYWRATPPQPAQIEGVLRALEPMLAEPTGLDHGAVVELASGLHKLGEDTTAEEILDGHVARLPDDASQEPAEARFLRGPGRREIGHGAGDCQDLHCVVAHGSAEPAQSDKVAPVPDVRRPGRARREEPM